MIDAVAVGKGITRRRKRNGLTQEELARMLNVTPQAVSKWENGLALPDTSMLPTLGYSLGVSIDELLIDRAVTFNEAQDTIIFNLDVTNFSIEEWEEAIFIRLMLTIERHCSSIHRKDRVAKEEAWLQDQPFQLNPILLSNLHSSLSVTLTESLNYGCLIRATQITFA